MSNPIMSLSKMCLNVAMWIFFLALFVYLAGQVKELVFSNGNTIELADESLEAVIEATNTTGGENAKKAGSIASKVKSVTGKHSKLLKTHPSSYRIFLFGSLFLFLSIIFYFAGSFAEK